MARGGFARGPPKHIFEGALAAQKLPAHAGHPLLSAAGIYQLGMAAARIFAPVNISLRHKTTCEPSPGGMLYLLVFSDPFPPAPVLQRPLLQRAIAADAAYLYSV